MRKNYSGTAILVRNSSELKPTKITYDIDIEKHSQEGRVTTAEFDNFILVSVYVPHAGCHTMNRLEYRVKEWDIDF